MIPHIPIVPSVDADEAAAMVAGGALLVDVREEEEFRSARIPGADLKPMSTIREWYLDLPRDDTVVIYCRTGQRSAQVVHALRDQAGFDNVVNLTGGIVRWSQDGHPIEP